MRKDCVGLSHVGCGELVGAQYAEQKKTWKALRVMGDSAVPLPQS
jgi:hypothetical protein